MPFHPQQEQYCGPAALATVLGWSGLPARQEALAREVFTPGREGTLGHDLIGAARRHGRLAVPVADLPSLLGELAAGHPVHGPAEPRSRLVPAVALCRRGRL